MEGGSERAYWVRADRAAKQKLQMIREFVDYLEGVKREVVLASARLSSDETSQIIGPSAEVAVAGIVHAINYLAVCRTSIQENDLVLTTRALASNT